MDRNTRRILLKILCDKIKNGEFNIKAIDPNKIYNLHMPVRQEYMSPYDRSSYNYGYMTSGEIGSGNEEAF